MKRINITLEVEGEELESIEAIVENGIRVFFYSRPYKLTSLEIDSEEENED